MASKTSIQLICDLCHAESTIRENELKFVADGWVTIYVKKHRRNDTCDSESTSRHLCHDCVQEIKARSKTL